MIHDLSLTLLHGWQWMFALLCSSLSFYAGRITMKAAMNEAGTLFRNYELTRLPLYTSLLISESKRMNILAVLEQALSTVSGGHASFSVGGFKASIEKSPTVSRFSFPAAMLAVEMIVLGQEGDFQSGAVLVKIAKENPPLPVSPATSALALSLFPHFDKSPILTSDVALADAASAQADVPKVPVPVVLLAPPASAGSAGV